MSERKGDRVQELFDRAVALPAAGRSAFLAAACADEPALRAEVESLLASDAEFAGGGGDEGALTSPLVRAPHEPDTASPPPESTPEPPLPSRVGRCARSACSYGKS